MDKKIKKIETAAVVVMLAFLIDRVFKVLALEMVGKDKAYSLFGDILTISPVLNTSGLFGIWTWKLPFSMAATSIVCLLLWAAYVTESVSNKIGKIGMLLVIGGILGNQFDRIVHGGVIDFLSIALPQIIWGQVRSPSFNLADLCIVAGALFVWFGIDLEFRPVKKDEEKSKLS
jgi:signal peptidase II